MSTDHMRRATRALAPLVALLASGCLPFHASSSLQDLCNGKSVGESLSLALDSLGPTPPSGLRRLQGHRFHVALSLFNPLSTAHCEDRGGEAHATLDALPDAIAAGASTKHAGRWWVDGTRIAVDLNPGVVDDNLELRLPLDGSIGSWSLSTIAGRTAWGRLIPGD